MSDGNRESDWHFSGTGLEMMVMVSSKFAGILCSLSGRGVGGGEEMGLMLFFLSP